MAESTPDTVYVLVMDLSGEKGGWREALPLFGDSLASIDAAKTVANNIVTARLALLPRLMTLDFARIVTHKRSIAAGSPNTRFETVLDPFSVSADSVGALTTATSAYPINGAYYGDSVGDTVTDHYVPNDDDDAAEIRVQTAEGPWGSRFIHGIPDSHKKGNQLGFGYSIPTANPASLTGAVQVSNGTWETVFGQYLAVLQFNTAMFRVRTSGNTKTFYLNTLGKPIVRKIKTKHVGIFFGQQRGRSRIK